MKGLRGFVDEMLDRFIASYQFQAADKESGYLSPVLNAIIYEMPGPEGEKGIEAICLELGITAWAEDIETVQKALHQLCMVYLKKIMQSKNADDIFYSDIIATDIEKFWVLHRVLMAMQKIESQNDTLELFEDMIERLLQENKILKNQIKALKNKNPETVILRVQTNNAKPRVSHFAHQAVQ